MRRSLQAMAIAASLVVLTASIAYASGSGNAAGLAQGEPLRNEGRIGWEMLWPSEDADAVRSIEARS